MASDTAEVEAEMIELDKARCEEYLRQHSFGRLAFVEAEDRAAIVPVNFTYDDGGIAIRTAVGSKLTNSPMTWIALEIDGVDPDGKWGWSVVASGRAFDISTAIDERSEELRDMAVATIAPGDKDHFISIHVISFTGRAFGNVPRLPTKAAQ